MVIINLFINKQTKLKSNNEFYIIKLRIVNDVIKFNKETQIFIFFINIMI
jgi:hypothetical protein